MAVIAGKEGLLSFKHGIFRYSIGELERTRPSSYFRVGGGRRSVAIFLYRALRPFKIANGLWLTRVLSIGYVLIQPFLAPPSHGWASEAGSFSVKLGSRSHSQPQHLIVRHLLF